MIPPVKAAETDVHVPKNLSRRVGSQNDIIHIKSVDSGRNRDARMGVKGRVVNPQKLIVAVGCNAYAAPNSQSPIPVAGALPCW